MAEKDATKGDSNFPLIRDGVASYLHDNDPEAVSYTHLRAHETS